MKRIGMLLLLLFFLVWSKPEEVSACSCVMPPPVDQALEEAKAVFSGKVVGITESTKSWNRGKTVTFQVNEIWKGEETGKIEIRTGLDDGDCGFPFVEGESYLVFATVNEMYGKNTLATGICHRTASLADASEELSELGSGKIIEQSNETTSVGNKTMDAGWKVAISCVLLILIVITIYSRKKK
ncbi:hypothetical protein [Sporosarcina cyprini]|uniref:hypothetical protein n=1 Tax=Sporosarcina cyprini TaxID=2910523 RepID=UPI001EDDF447|nr:hypothetical protein [Sporosarcina cyprini]MCG3087725.1 hypothetical protein [Sporosarcina cyprini]